MKSWCILRTAPSRTVPLCKELIAGGFCAWTPQAIIKRAVPRSNVKRLVTISLTPTVVFAEYDQLPALLALSRSVSMTIDVWNEETGRVETRSIPPFSIFKPFDAYPRVQDRELDALRMAEQRGRPKAHAPVFSVGQSVRYADAGFQGLVGRVERVMKRDVLVSFAGLSYAATIPKRSLLSVQHAA